jgi:hypothetical protein
MVELAAPAAVVMMVGLRCLTDGRLAAPRSTLVELKYRKLVAWGLLTVCDIWDIGRSFRLRSHRIEA